MADASLTVRMALDRLALKQGLDGAGKDVDGFKKHFESSLRETRGAVKDVAGSIDGIGRAFEGSIGGAVAGFKDFTQLLSASPWAAWSAAGVAAVAAVVKAVENMYTKLDEAGSKAGKERAKNRKDVVEALGIKSPDDLADKSYAQIKEGAKSATTETERLTKEITALNKQISGLEKNVSWYDALSLTSEDTASQVEALKNKLAELEKQRGEAARKANSMSDAAVSKELAAERSKVDAFNKRVREQLKAEEDAAKEKQKADEKQAEREKKLAQLGDDYAQKRAELEDARYAKNDRKYSSIFERTDMYQRMGGQVGANISGALVREDKMAQLAEDQLKVSERIETKLQELNLRFDEATNKIAGED